ncbi:MAG: serpin family protein [Clostridia bacterium]|nr:serpin family protein [Clostridia bacterium]
MRGFVLVVYVLAMCLMFGATAQASPTIILDGKEIDAKGIIEEGQTLVPMRIIFEALEAQVSYVQGAVTVTKGQDTVKLVIGERVAYINGKETPLDVTPRIVNERTMVPLRLVSEALGADVKWEPASRTIGITTACCKPPVAVDKGAFDFSLFAEVVKQDGEENIFISPVSVALALSMVYNGAAAETKEAMAEVLRVRGIAIEDVNKANAALLKALNANPDVQLDVANSVWARKDVTFTPEFLKTLKDYYSAEATTLDFNDPGAPDIINSWVQDKTNGKIDAIIEEIKPDEVMFLINAIYFLGQWTTEFDKKHTQERPFHPAQGGQKDVPMMWQQGDLRYYQGDQFEAIELPYGKNKSASMYVFLPGRDSSLNEFYADLNVSNWAKWQAQFATKEGQLSLPRFSLEYEQELTDVLTNLGMGIAFEPYAADFSGLYTPPPWAYISEVKHKAVVDVDEKGTEAAAVTSIGIGLTSISVDQPFNMVVDRPFFFAIVDNQTDSILFMGSVVNP